MPNRSTPRKDGAIEHLLSLLTNCRDLAVGQQLAEARDVLRGARLVASGFGIDASVVFDQLDKAIISKPFYVLNEEFLRAAKVIKSKA